MSSSQPRRSFLSKISTKLTLIYCFGLVFSTLLIFSAVYIQVVYTLESKDKQILKSKYEEFLGRLESRGIEDLKEYYSSELDFYRDPEMIVLVYSAQGDLLFSRYPEPFFKLKETDLSPLLDRGLQNAYLGEVELEGNAESGFVMVGAAVGGERLMVVKSVNVTSSSLDRVLRLFWWSLVPIIIMGLIIGYWVSNRVLMPLRELVSTIRGIQDGQLSRRMPLNEVTDELEELKQLFNRMLDRVELSLTGLREAFDHLAHDIRTPVTRLRGRAEIALNGEESVESYREALQSCYENSDKILKFLETLTQISEAENQSLKLKRELKSLGDILNEIMDLYEIAFEEKNIRVEKVITKNDEVDVDVGLIKRVVANLLDNACKYTPEHGEVTIETYRTDRHIVLSVKDSGMGIPPEEQTLIWTRLFRGDKSRSAYGMGLGLTFVKAVVQAHGGEVSVISPLKAGRGTEFLIKLKIPGLRLPHRSAPV